MTDRRWRLIAAALVTAIIVLLVAGGVVTLAAWRVYATFRGQP